MPRIMPLAKLLPYVLPVALLLGGSWAKSAEESLKVTGAVKLTKSASTVDVTINGEPFAVYNFDPMLPKPFFSPVRSQGGAIVTRSLEKPEDHPHHKGIWLAIDEVNDVGFWAEKGKIQNVAISVGVEGNPAKLHVENNWLGLDNKPILLETTDITIYPNRLLCYDIQLKPAAGPVTFGDTKEGLFGIRVPNSLREGKGGDGKVVNAEGLEGSKNCWGKTSKWVDYYGSVDGQKHGVAIFDHPGNAKPSRFHVRDYGLFTLSPFGDKSYTGGKEEEKPFVLNVNSTYRLRYGLYIHPGTTEDGKVSQVYDFFVKNMSGS